MYGKCNEIILLTLPIVTMIILRQVLLKRIKFCFESSYYNARKNWSVIFSDVSLIRALLILKIFTWYYNFFFLNNGIVNNLLGSQPPCTCS